MKSKLLYLMIFALTTVSMVGCDDESTAGMTRITYYPELILEGATTLYCNVGETFTDPGYTATLNGEDVTSDVVVASTVNTSAQGIYSIGYSITNPDGFSSNAARTVIVMGHTDTAAGSYGTDPNSYRMRSGTQTVYGASYGISVADQGDGTYAVSDLLGGYYEQRAGYGGAYALKGTISIADDGTITLNTSSLEGWGDSADSMTDGKFDADKGCLSWAVNYAGMDFYVTMYKK